MPSWGSPALARPCCSSAAVIAATGISTLVATLAKTVEQAGGLNAIVALSMAAIGGVFIPLSQAPELLAPGALITPHAWFLRAIDTLAVPGRRLSSRSCPRSSSSWRWASSTGAIGLLRARRLAGADMKALVIARVNMVRTFRDRMSLFFILVLPMILIVVLGMTYGGMNTARVGIADEDGGPLAVDLVAAHDRDRASGSTSAASGPPMSCATPSNAGSSSSAW